MKFYRYEVLFKQKNIKNWNYHCSTDDIDKAGITAKDLLKHNKHFKVKIVSREITEKIIGHKYFK